MSSLPTGVVTFVFTDIEGSTRLLEELGPEAYGELLSQHHRVCRVAWAAHGGAEVDTAGDAFFVAFPTASGALAASVDAQEALAELGLRVRIGVHTGEVSVTDTGYVGLEVHRAARIAAAGHGGQVLVSASTAALAGSAGLVDLGEHRFKDLAAPERVFQLGVVEFPPIRSLYRSNLPVPATPFLGREAELREVVGRLLHPDTRLLTLTGPGGTGKTRLALQAAAEASDHFRDGVWWVPLAPLRDPALVLSNVAQALEVQEEPGRDLAGTLAARLGGKRTLLVLDNLEHLLPDATSSVTALRDVGGPVVLVTSRERLQLRGEETYSVPSLERSEAVELFVGRARSAGVEVAPDGVASELCARLDDLPLAIELAAARTVVFAPEQLLGRIGERLDLLKGARDADPRQQTLRATIEWSYDLLDLEERRLLRALSVFVGGATFEAVEHVADADPDNLQSLIDRSLVRRRDTAYGPRYWMLESILGYAAERLGEDDAQKRSLCERHAVQITSLVEEAREQLRLESRKQWIDRLEDELPNIRSAVEWLVVERPSAALHLAASLYRFWLSRSHLAEGRRILEKLLPAFAQVESVDVYRGLQTLGDIARHQGDLGLAEACAGRMLAIARSQDAPTLEANALASASTIRSMAGDFAAAIEMCKDALVIAERVGDPDEIGRALSNMTYCLLGLDDYAQARRSAERALRASPTKDSVDLLNLGLALRGCGEDDRALIAFGEAFQLVLEQADSLQLSYIVDIAAAIVLDRGDPELAVALCVAADAIRREAGVAIEPVEEKLAVRTREIAIAAVGPERGAQSELRGRSLDQDDVIGCVSGVLGTQSHP